MLHYAVDLFHRVKRKTVVRDSKISCYRNVDNYKNGKFNTYSINMYGIIHQATRDKLSCTTLVVVVAVVAVVLMLFFLCGRGLKANIIAVTSCFFKCDRFCPSVLLSVMLFPPKPLDRVQQTSLSVAYTCLACIGGWCRVRGPWDVSKLSTAREFVMAGVDPRGSYVKRGGGSLC